MQAYHKAEKQKALKKAKVEKLKQRTEKLARKNPDRIQRQIDDLKALEAREEIKPFEKKLLGELENELKAVKRARETLGIKEEEHHHHQRRSGSGAVGTGGTGGSRVGRGSNNNRESRGGLTRLSRNQEREESDSGESTSSSVREIPMPPGTPPPLPRRKLSPPRSQQTQPRQPHALPPKPVLPAPVTTYSAAPIVRDLRKEAAALVPAVVQRKVLEKRKERERSKETEGRREGKEGEDEEEDGKGFIKRVMVNAAPEVEVGEEVGLDVDEDEEYLRFRKDMEIEIREDETGKRSK